MPFARNVLIACVLALATIAAPCSFAYADEAVQGGTSAQSSAQTAKSASSAEAPAKAAAGSQTQNAAAGSRAQGQSSLPVKGTSGTSEKESDAAQPSNKQTAQQSSKKPEASSAVKSAEHPAKQPAEQPSGRQATQSETKQPAQVNTKSASHAGAQKKVQTAKQASKEQTAQTTRTTNGEKKAQSVQSAKKYAAPLEAGEYYFQSTLGAYVLDVSGGSKKNGGNVQIYSSNQTDAQKWHIEHDADGLYTITSVNSKKALDVSGAAAANGTNIQQYTSNKTAAQKWIIKKKDETYTFVSSINPSYVLDVSGANAADGTNVQVWKSNGTAAQRFFALPIATELHAERIVEDGVYEIASAGNKSYVLDVEGASSKNSANVQLYKRNNTDAQRWGIVWNKEGYYSVFSIASGKDLDVGGASVIAGANVAQYTYNKTIAQRWALHANNDGTHSFESALSGNVLDVAGASYKNAANVQVYVANGTDAQKFVLKRIPIAESGVYEISSKKDGTYALDTAGWYSNNMQLNVRKIEGSPAQRVIVDKDSSTGIVTLQLVATGKFVTDAGGKAVQRSRSQGDEQRWSVTFSRSGFRLRNVATRAYLGLEATTPAQNVKVMTKATPDATCGFRFTPKPLIDDGYYVLAPLSATKQRLDVARGSKKAGANVQIHAANNTAAQMFFIAKAEGGSYRISMAFTNNAVEAGGLNAKAGANVRMGAWQSAQNQLWDLVINDGGLMLQNRNSGLVMGVGGDGASNGANVQLQERTNARVQRWIFRRSALASDDMSLLTAIIRSASGATTVSINPAGGAAAPSKSTVNALLRAVTAIWDEGYNVGFILSDPRTGSTVSLCADDFWYSASTIKGPYVTHLFQKYFETGWVDPGPYESDIEYCITVSSNECYASLRQSFGPDEFRTWLDEVGLTEVSSGSWYFDITPRQLQLMWAHIYEYASSAGRYTGWWRDTFSHSYYSSIYNELSGPNTTYSKPGWYPRGYGIDALHDSGIVDVGGGRDYLVTVLSDIECYGDEWLEENLVRALHNVYTEMTA